MDGRPKDDHVADVSRKTPVDNTEDRIISRDFWRHVLIGYAAGLAIGAVIFVILLLTMNRMELKIPAIFIIAALAQIGTGGGLVGAGIYMSRVIDRDDDDDSSDPPRGRKLPLAGSQKFRSDEKLHNQSRFTHANEARSSVTSGLIGK